MPPDLYCWYLHIYVIPYCVILGLVCVTARMCHKQWHVTSETVRDIVVSILFAHFPSEHPVWGKPASLSRAALKKGSCSEEQRPLAAATWVSLENGPSTPIKAFGWPQRQLTAWQQPHEERSWEHPTPSQVHIFRIVWDNTVHFCSSAAKLWGNTLHRNR